MAEKYVTEHPAAPFWWDETEVWEDVPFKEAGARYVYLEGTCTREQTFLVSKDGSTVVTVADLARSRE